MKKGKINIENPSIKESLIKKLAKKTVFYFDKVKDKILDLFVKKNNVEKERKISRRVYDAISEGRRKDNKAKRIRQSHVRRDISKSQKNSKTLIWLKRSAFSLGKVRITRLALVVSAVFIIAVTTGAVITASLMHNPKEESSLSVDEENMKTVYIVYGDVKAEIKTSAETVGEVLKENDISYEDDETLSQSPDKKIYSNMTIEIRQPFKVSIQYIDEEKEVYLSDGIVQDAFDKLGLKYDFDDIIVPSLSTELYPDISIKYDAVEVVTITEDVEVKYETEYGETSTVVAGMYAITQKGVNGVAKNTVEITYMNGVEVSREIVSEELVKAPVNKIVLNGTGKRKEETTEGNGSTDEYDNIVVTNPGQQATNPSVPSAPTSYEKVMSAHVTAYTHTGSTTATGTWPRSTRTLENPGSCAVVKETFPYGSLLYVTGYGYCIAEDTGGFRFDPDRWNQIDVFMNTEAECVVWGRRRDCTIYVLRYGY